MDWGIFQKKMTRISASLHSVSVGAKPLSTGQCAPCRRLYQMGIDSPPTDTDLLLAPTEVGDELRLYLLDRAS